MGRTLLFFVGLDHVYGRIGNTHDLPAQPLVSETSGTMRVRFLD